MRSVHDELGGVIYRQYCGRALQNGALGDQERMFLGQIKSTLDMEQETCDKLVRDCELGRVRTMVDVMFERGQVLAPDVRKMRDMADTLDVDLVRTSMSAASASTACSRSSSRTWSTRAR